MSFFGDKPSSRVLRPPGGGSSNIFGGSEEPTAGKKSPKPTFQSSVFSAEPEQAKPRSANRPGNMSSNIFGTDPETNTVRMSPNKVSKTHQSSIFKEPEAMSEEKLKAGVQRHDPITGAVLNQPREHTPALATPPTKDDRGKPCEGEDRGEPEPENNGDVTDHNPHMGPVKNTSGVRCAQPPGGKSSISFS